MSSHPIFCERFVFLVENPEKDWLSLDFFNMKNNKSGGNLRMRISEICHDKLTLSEFLTRELVTKTPTGQRKDPKIVFSCEFRKLLHTTEIMHKLNFALPRKQTLRRAWKNAENRLFEQPTQEHAHVADPNLRNGMLVPSKKQLTNNLVGRIFGLAP